MRQASFFDYTRSDVGEMLGHAARATALFKAVYQGKMSSLPASAQSALVEFFNVDLPPVVRHFESADGTVRRLLQLEDGELAESVLIPEQQRFTICVSSQIGCALACKFCLTGQLGLTRNLSAGEIISQVLVQRMAASSRNSARFSVVLMGMGEPLQNYENVLKSIRILTDDNGLAVPLHRITLSTAGVLPGLERLASESLFPNLSISLTGATNSKRDELMPINRKYPIEDVVEFVRRLPESRQKRVMFEIVMMKGVTDSIDDAHLLSGLLRGLTCKINLIPLNPSPDIDFEPSSRSDVLRFQQVLMVGGIATFIRKTRGGDVSGACGQLKKAGSIAIL